GSIGRELCRQVLACEPAALILLGHGENSIFEATRELERLCAQRGLANVAIRPLIADVRFGDRIRHLFAEVKPDVVFHAAAHKHVPLMEANPSEAITNNVLGTRNVVNAAVAAGVGRLVMISTDKAVNPTSVMGASKRTAEMVLMQAAHRHNLPYVAVRFGNVLGSRGSVVPIFQRQIAEGGPITVTDPEMRRYFMTIPEAVQLVLQAAVLGQRGEIFVLDMGEQVRIRDMAEALVRLSGLEVGRDIDIIYTGLRPGEKLYEELFVASEAYVKTAHGKVFMASNGAAAVPTDLDAFIDALAASAQRYDDAAIIRCLGALIPGYQPLSRSEPCPHHPGHCPAQSGRAKPCPPGAASASAD
ncbi:MAG: polysaccharide biosynthesis protein, partial [Caldilineaceae bacterium]|nr:polysaccharide biosynthesis protein [Caldilineaceae bacterium]